MLIKSDDLATKKNLLKVMIIETGRGMGLYELEWDGKIYCDMI